MDTNKSLLIKDILAEAVKSGAHDLHFSVGNYPALRIGKEWNQLEDREIVTQEFMSSLVQMLLDEEQQKKLSESKEIIFGYNFDKNLRFKINIFYQKGFLSATFRYIAFPVPALSSLNLNPLIKDLTSSSSGLIIIAGPFGSGRSTTAAAIIEEINQNYKKYVITIEDPIEYLFTNKKSIIEQREVGRDTASFQEALSYFQEEDGDVLFLENLNDPKIIPLALEIASGSALVVTTMSANSTAQAVASILDNFTSFDQERIRDLLARSLRAIICQKFIPKIGGGLMVIQEIMLANDAIKSIILSGSISQLDNIVQTSRREGMVSFDTILAELVKGGEVSPQEALEQANNKNGLEKTIS